MKEIPKIEVKGDILIISMSASDLKWITENKLDSSYKVRDELAFLKDFAEELKDYSNSNSLEKGLSNLQYLFDEVIDETYTNGSDNIVNEEEDGSS